MNRVHKGIIAAVISIVICSVALPIGGTHASVSAQPLAASTYRISGNAGVGGATLQYVGGSVTAFNNGDYFINVPVNWSGTVTPSKQCYSFSPGSLTYQKVKQNFGGQNYTARILHYTISGFVMLPNGTGIGGVKLAYVDGTAKSVLSDPTGAYSFRVPCGWSGPVTASKTGYTFETIHHAPVLADQTGHNYLANYIPTNILFVPTSVPENQPPGTAVGRLTTIDADEGDTHTYSFCPASNNGSFTVSGDTLYTASVFNFEVKKSYKICIRTADHQGASFDKPFEIAVTDANDPPTGIEISPGGILVDPTIGDLAGTLSTVDEDAADSYTYSDTEIVGQDCTGNELFRIDDDALWVASDIDGYDEGDSIPICVRSVDSGEPALAIDGTLYIHVVPAVKIRGNTEIADYTITYSDTATNASVQSDPQKMVTSVGQGYTLSVPQGWGGTVAPSKPGFEFQPPQRTYSVVRSDLTNQNFKARPQISGNVEVAGAQVCHYESTWKCVDSDEHGNFKDSVPYNWSGLVKVSKTDYTFSPKSYWPSYVRNPVSGLKFEANLKPPVISWPRNNTTLFNNINSTPTIEWTKLSTIDSYLVSICRSDNGTACPISGQSVPCDTGACTYTIPDSLPVGKKYDICVKAQDGSEEDSRCKPVSIYMGFKYAFDHPDDLQDWVEGPGANWSISARGYLEATSTASNISSIVYINTLKDFTFQARLLASSRTRYGLVVRVSEPFTARNDWYNGYYLEIVPNERRCVLYNYSNGEHKPKKKEVSTSINSTTWNTLKVRAYEDSLTFSINGTPLCNPPDLGPIHLTGQVGFFLYGPGSLKVNDAKLTMPPAPQ